MPQVADHIRPGFAGRVSRLASREHRAQELPDLARPEVRARLLEAMRAGWRADVEIEGLRRAEGGFSSETWFLDVTAGGTAETVVLRRQALVGPLEPYDLAREVAVVRALAESSTTPLRTPPGLRSGAPGWTPILYDRCCRPTRSRWASACA